MGLFKKTSPEDILLEKKIELEMAENELRGQRDDLKNDIDNSITEAAAAWDNEDEREIRYQSLIDHIAQKENLNTYLLSAIQGVYNFRNLIETELITGKVVSIAKSVHDMFERLPEMYDSNAQLEGFKTATKDFMYGKIKQEQFIKRLSQFGKQGVSHGARTKIEEQIKSRVAERYQQTTGKEMPILDKAKQLYNQGKPTQE